MDRATFIRLLQTEITRHNFDTFVDEPPAVAQGGKGIVVVGCAACKVQMQTTSQFLQHIAAGIPAWFDVTVPPKSVAVEREQHNEAEDESQIA
jgi:hypothetical protein